MHAACMHSSVPVVVFRIHGKSAFTPKPMQRPCKSILDSAPSPTHAGETTPNQIGIHTCRTQSVIDL